MIERTLKAPRRLLLAAPLALAVALAACGGGNGRDGGGNVGVAPSPTPAPAPTPSPTPTPTPSPTSRNVSACLNQVIPGTGGATPASLAVPDTIKLNFAAASGFPNGRLLQDPVIDVTLAVLLLDLARHSPATFAAIPLNPPHDSTLLGSFPFLGTANGGQPGPGTGTAFNFRTDPASAYVRVDRMGQPAVATALIGSAQKNPYNDANPSDDVAGTFVPEITSQLTALHNALADDLIALGLRPCST